MAEERVQRRLAAIVAADVVGYSRLMGNDEEGTLAALTADLDGLIKPCIAEYRGRLFKTTGDGLLAEFGSVVDAVQCAVAFQNGMAERSGGTSEKRRIQFRIGINLGDVIVQDGDVFGDGVNVAARLEGLAEPGGIVVSGTVHAQVRTKLPFNFNDLGDQAVKNIAEPVRAYSIVDRALLEDSAEQSSAIIFAEKPSVAVLPFTNMSGDPEQEYFGDGIAEDIITALCQFHWFLVIARNTSFTYKNRAVDLRQVAEELSVRYILEGSVRKVGNRVRISAQLIDTAKGTHVWAQRYDRELEDIFSVQDEITESIISSAAPEILHSEMVRASRKDIRNLDVWDLVMRAHWHLSRVTQDDFIQARRLITKATEIDPNNSYLFSDLGLLCATAAVWDWGESRAALNDDALMAGQKAVALDGNNAWANTTLGYVYLFARRHDDSIDRLRTALDLCPNDANANGFMGVTLAFSGDSEAALAHLNQAIRLSPRDPFLAFWYVAAADAEFAAGRYDEAVNWGRKTIQQTPGFIGGHRVTVASLGQLGLVEDAQPFLTELLANSPNLTVEDTSNQLPWKRPRDMERYLDGLRTAGLPESSSEVNHTS